MGQPSSVWSKPFDPPTKKRYPRTKHEVDRMTSCDIWPFEIWHITRGVFIWHPILGKRVLVGSHRSHHSMVVSYRLSTTTTCDNSAVICHRMSATLKSTGVGGSFWSKIWCVPFGVDPRCWCLQRVSTPTSCNYFRRIQTYVITLPWRHGQTDGQTTCRSNRQNRLKLL